MNELQAPPAALPPGTKVYAYIRDSGGANQELSVTRQIGEITRWANQHELTVTEFFTDEERSGRTTRKREELAKLMLRFRAGGIQERGLIVWAYSRFARNAIQSQLYRSEIRSLGFVFHSLTDVIPDGRESVIFEAFKDYANDQFSAELSINVKSGLRAVLENHKGMPGTPPRGFMREPIEIGIHRDGRPRIVHRWIPDPDLVPTVRMAFEMRARGATLKQIMDATHLYPVINSWKTFFNNRIYMGILEYGDLVIEDYCEPIVTREVWDKVQNVGRERAHLTKDNSKLRRFSSSFILSGLVYCQSCGSPLNGHVISGRDKSRRDYYVCSRKARRRDCDARQIPARPLEAAILKALEDIALDLEQLMNFQAMTLEHYRSMGDQTQGTLRRLRRELGIQTKRINNLITAIAERGHSRALLDGLHKAEVEAAAVRVEIENIEKSLIPPETLDPLQLSALADELKSALHGENIQKQKHAIHMLTSRIIVSREDEQVNAMLYYIPSVCLRGSALAEDRTVGIQIIIPIALRRNYWAHR
jgi:DNA invertase Pin-like site-specific DNA recombinase